MQEAEAQSSDEVNISKVDKGKQPTTEKMSKKPKDKTSLKWDSDAVGTSESATPSKKKKVVKGSPRASTVGLKQYVTSRYTRYNPATSNGPAAIDGAFAFFSKYDSYHLFIDPHLTDVARVPTSWVRLDDLTVSKVIVNGKAKWLNSCWPAEFDVLGMVRATRMPLGIAAKRYCAVGDIDLDGNQIGVGEEGWFYYWWQGIHLLCSKEGMEADLYSIRPSHEAFKAEGLSWVKSHRAVSQTTPEADVV